MNDCSRMSLSVKYAKRELGQIQPKLEQAKLDALDAVLNLLGQFTRRGRSRKTYKLSLVNGKRGEFNENRDKSWV